jgi:hypothetical protein
VTVKFSSQSQSHTGHTQKNCVFSSVNKQFISHPTWAQHTLSAAGTVQVSLVLQQFRFSFLLRGRGTSFQYGDSAGEGFVCEREFRARFKNDASYKNNVTKWYRQFVEIGCLCKGRSPGRPCVSDNNIERLREAFQQSPRKSVARTSRKFAIPKMTVCKVLRERLCFELYKFRLVQALTPA